jgi:hypothetical protein
MNKFREMGFIDYSDTGGLTVHSGLLSVVLSDGGEQHSDTQVSKETARN